MSDLTPQEAHVGADVTSALLASHQLTPSEAMALPCYDNPTLWQDDERPPARRKAQALCLERCTQLEWCERERQAAVRDLGYGAGAGVWAGKIWTVGDLMNERRGESPSAA